MMRPVQRRERIAIAFAKALDEVPIGIAPGIHVSYDDIATGKPGGFKLSEVKELRSPNEGRGPHSGAPWICRSHRLGKDLEPVANLEAIFSSKGERAVTKRISVLVAFTIPALSFFQSLSFDAASIKPRKDGDHSSSWNTHPGYLVVRNQTLKTLVGIAYGVPDDRVSGGPKWIDGDRFDLEARAAKPAKDSELLLMLQNLLGERFHLAVHRETKTTSGFFLTLAKGGLKIHPDETEGRSSWNGGRGKIIAQRITMAKLADTLTRMLRSPVVDMTSTTARYSFTLEWTPENERASDGVRSDPSTGTPIFTALSQDLGLRLESRKVPIETIVIDKADQPTEN